MMGDSLDLNSRLIQDTDGFELRIYRELLDAQAEKCSRVFDAGLRADDASKIRPILEAYRAGADVLVKLWSSSR